MYKTLLLKSILWLGLCCFYPLWSYAEPELKKAKNPITAMVQKSAKAVVNLYVVQRSQQGVYNPFVGDPSMDFLFGGAAVQARPRVSYGSGSGVIISEKGLLVTCAHVVDKADTIKAKLNDGREFDVKLLSVDKKNDLAFGQLQLSATENVPSVPIGNSEDVEIAEPIYAIGNAFGLGQSVSNGIISATTRIVGGRVLLQTDASVNPGNSGGALIDMNGQLIGVPNAILSRSGASHGIGFAIPTALIKNQVKRIQSGDKTQGRIWFGLSVQSLTFDMAKTFDGFDFSRYQGGAIVGKVKVDSALQKAGLKVNDVIVKVNQQPIRNEEEFAFQEEVSNIGDNAIVTVWRKGEGEKEIPFKIEQTVQEPTQEIILKGKHFLSGYKIGKITESFAQEHKLDSSFVGKVIVLEQPQQGSQAFGLNIAVGDILISINGKAIVEPHNVDEVLKMKKRRSINLVIQRDNAILQIVTG